MVTNRNVKPDPAKRKPGAPLSEAEKATIRKRVADGATHASICRELGIGTSTLSRFKKLEGISTVPVVDTSGASNAYKRNAAAKRAERVAIMDELYQLRSAKILKVERGQEKYKTLVKIPGGGEITESLSYIPAADWRSEVASLATLATAIDRADDRADDGGLARAQSMLQMVLQGLTGKQIDVPADQGTFES